MEIKQLVQKFVYRIEAKPEGGFIARAVDPTIPPLEAPTREELQRMIQAKVMAGLGESFPGLKIPAQSGQRTLAFQLDRKADGGISVHAEQAGGSPLDPATEEKIEHYAEQLLGFVDKHFPHLSEKMAEQVRLAALNAVSGGQAGSDEVAALEGVAQGIQQEASRPYISGANLQTDVKVERTTLNNAVVVNTPITPEASGNKGVLRFLVGLVILIAVYYLLHHRG